MNPWHVEALKIITGSEEEAHKPLTHILENYFDLEVDKIMNLTGWAGCHPIDTQGCKFDIILIGSSDITCLHSLLNYIHC